MNTLPMMTFKVCIYYFVEEISTWFYGDTKLLLSESFGMQEGKIHNYNVHSTVRLLFLKLRNNLSQLPPAPGDLKNLRFQCVI